jgi:hypothetical protein
MFSFFGKKEIKIKIIDRVFISSKAKQYAIQEQIRNYPDRIIITWFDESYEQIKALLQSNNLKAEIYLSREIPAHNILNKKVLFLEHHPLVEKEKELLEKLQLKQAIFYSALDEPLFKFFGGDRISSMIEKLGLSENEAIEHQMISTAIKNAQEKISKQVVIDYSAQSQAGWFSKNIVK